MNQVNALPKIIDENNSKMSSYDLQTFLQKKLEGDALYAPNAHTITRYMSSDLKEKSGDSPLEMRDEPYDIIRAMVFMPGFNPLIVIGKLGLETPFVDTTIDIKDIEIFYELEGPKGWHNINDFV